MIRSSNQKMKNIAIHTNSGPSHILIGECLENLKQYVPAARPIIITDVKVAKLYPMQSMATEVISIGTGEEIKTLETAQDIYAQLVSSGADRCTFIVGIGGGIVCDIAGFVASTFLRGVRFGFVATTLLAQVDAGIGGKNGVNFQGYKNIIGLFRQPEFVICDPEVLKTLPQKEISCGLAEIVKHAAVADPDLFAYLERHAKDLLALDPPAIKKVVATSVRIKSSIIRRDESEKGERRILNFGHTFGHAIEMTAGVPHGAAVSMGMALASSLSVKRGLLTTEENRRLQVLLNDVGLPTRFESETESLFEAIGKDKKRAGEHIHFVLLDGIGNAVVEKMTINKIKDMLNG